MIMNPIQTWLSCSNQWAKANYFQFQVWGSTRPWFSGFLTSIFIFSDEALDEEITEEPPIKVPKIDTPNAKQTILPLEDVMALLQDCQLIDEENLQNLYDSILHYKLGLKDCISAVVKYEEKGVSQIVLPILKRGKYMNTI